MDNSNPLERFFAHPKRNWGIAAFSLIVLVLFVLPTWDSYQQAAEEYQSQSQTLAQIETSLASAKAWQADDALNSHALSSSTGIGELAAQACRETLVQKAFNLNCTTHRVSLSDPARRDWFQGDDLLKPNSDHKQKKAEYEIETRELSLTVSGSLSNISKLINEISSLDRFACPTDMTLQRQGDTGKCSFEVTILLIHLMSKID